MEAKAAAAAAAHRRVKRAMGLLRTAAASLAAELGDVDLIGEVHVEAGGRGRDELDELLRLAAHRHGDVDVVVLAAPRSSSSP